MHDLRQYFNLSFLTIDGRFDDRANLHLQNFRISDRKPAPAMPEHRVRLVKLLYSASHRFRRDADFLRQLFLFGAIVWDELMQRRIDHPNGHRKAIHGLKNSDEVAPLEWQQLVERFTPRLGGVREDHLLNRVLALDAFFGMLEILEEHVLGAAEADALRAHFSRHSS